MAVKIPFVVQPKLDSVIEIIGTDASGRIEIERKGYLTVAEKAFVQAATGGSNMMHKIYGTASRIAAKTKKSAQQVFEDISKQEDVDYLKPYQGEIAEMLVEANDMQEKMRVFAAAALIMNRIDENIEIEQVMDLHPDLLEALHELYQEEDARDTSRLDVVKEEAEEGESAGKS